MRPTLRIIAESPHEKAPLIKSLTGAFGYCLLTDDGQVAIGGKVALVLDFGGWYFENNIALQHSGGVFFCKRT